jgi:hypothetical protein
VGAFQIIQRVAGSVVDSMTLRVTHSIAAASTYEIWAIPLY